MKKSVCSTLKERHVLFRKIFWEPTLYKDIRGCLASPATGNTRPGTSLPPPRQNKPWNLTPHTPNLTQVQSGPLEGASLFTTSEKGRRRQGFTKRTSLFILLYSPDSGAAALITISPMFCSSAPSHVLSLTAVPFLSGCAAHSLLPIPCFFGN